MSEALESYEKDLLVAWLTERIGPQKNYRGVEIARDFLKNHRGVDNFNTPDREFDLLVLFMGWATGKLLASRDLGGAELDGGPDPS